MLKYFIARNTPFGIKQYQYPLGRKLEGRVFWGEIKENWFEIVTMPEMREAFRHTLPGIKKFLFGEIHLVFMGVFRSLMGRLLIKANMIH
ncbi:MAG: hypothetical protein K2M91_05395 [Lachnospiraceae bacterium]|nr:hypothetical protein [Lachnospiraceae bacterium]